MKYKYFLLPVIFLAWLRFFYQYKVPVRLTYSTRGSHFIQQQWNLSVIDNAFPVVNELHIDSLVSGVHFQQINHL